MAMSAPSSSSSLISPSSPFCPHPLHKITFPPVLSLSHSLRPFFPTKSGTCKNIKTQKKGIVLPRAQTLDFSGSFFEGGGFGSDDESSGARGLGTAVVEDKPEPQCPPGLRQYETMAVLRPDMSEDERLGLTQKYEELLVAGGAMYIEVFNRGVIPLAYSIKKKNKAGETNTYLDGIFLLFTYFTKPDSITALEATLKTDDDVIRSSTFKIRKRKY